METSLATASEKQKWISKYFAEYVRRSRFLPYMGRGETNVIIAKYELQDEAGKTINIPLITRLDGNGVGGSAVLDGNEEELGNYNCPISIDWARNGVRVPKSTSYKTEIDLLDAGKSMLRQWSAEDLRTDIIYALMEVVTSGSTTEPYAEITVDAVNGGYEIVSGYTAGSSFLRRQGVTWTSADESDKDAWLAANLDRILFGKLRSNTSGTDHSASLGNIDTTDDKLTVAVGSLAKRMAQNANPHIRPFQLEDGREFFVMFCGPRSFRDLKTDTVLTSANRDARARDVANNPLFQDGDQIYDGVIYREVPEIPHITDVGNGSAEVEPNFLCGQQAIGIAWGQEPTPQSDRDKDYKFRPGVAIEELRGVKKLAFNGKQHGVVTVYTAAAGD